MRLHLIWERHQTGSHGPAVGRRRRGIATFRLRQLLQFMASRGSVVTRRVGRRSMPICGLDMVESSGGGQTSVDVQTGARIGQDTYLAGSNWQEAGGREALKAQGSTGITGRCEMDVQIKASGAGTRVETKLPGHRRSQIGRAHV